MRRALTILGTVILLGAAGVAFSLYQAAEARRQTAQAQVTRWAEQLQSRTTDAGVFIRAPGNPLPENDPWGTPLQVSYAQGGFAETLTVRSAGPDGTFYTADDLVAQRWVVNFKGVGTGARDNIEEFTHRAGRGATRGVAAGIRAAVSEARAGQAPVPPK